MREGQDPLEQVYDAETLEAIEAWARARVADEEPDKPVAETRASTGSAASMAGAVWAAALLGAGEALEGEQLRPDVAEYVPSPPEGDQAVTFLFVPGDPQASRIIVRPWLLG